MLHPTMLGDVGPTCWLRLNRPLCFDKLVCSKVITQCHLAAMLSYHLKELKTAIQCLGIKPKAINK